MQDKTAIGISDLLRQFIEALVEEVVLEGKPFDDQKKKWLQRYSQEEGLDYATLEKNLTEFFETLDELKLHESKAVERLAKMLAKDCYLEDGKVEELLTAMNEAREKGEAERIATEKIAEEERLVNEKAGREAEMEAERKESLETIKQIDGHEYVDLGLPSGTLWSSCNVGATKPEEYGDYYAWGEIEKQKKKDYCWNTYIHCNGLEGTCHDLGNTICGTRYDVAYVKWGTKWQMPTSKQIEELIDNCSYKWTTLNGIRGGRFTSKNNGKSIFLPAADSLIGNRGGFHEYGNYWSGMQNLIVKDEAYTLWFAGNKRDSDRKSRCYGCSVRPVSTVSIPASSTYMKTRGGDIFNEMPGGHLLKEKTLDKTSV